MEKIKVLFIGGEGRSGSTLLDMMLGQIPGFVSCGEIRNVWQEGLIDNMLCSCGAHFRDCEFWLAVGKEAFGGWDALDVPELLGLARFTDRPRVIPFLMKPELWPKLKAKLEVYNDYLVCLYRSIQKVSGSKVIVDSSKYPSTALILSRLRDFDVRVIHLVRDSRGVAYSWMKHLRKPGSAKLMLTFHPATTSRRWFATNIAFHLMAGLKIPTMLLRYESLIMSPMEALRHIMEHIDESASIQSLGFVDHGQIHLSQKTHVVAGNPRKMSQGILEVRPDEEWREKMNPRHWLLVTLMTWPLLLNYGYLVQKNGRWAELLSSDAESRSVDG